MAWGWSGGSCCKPRSCQPTSLGPGLTTSIFLFLLLLSAIPLKTWLFVKLERSLPLVVVWLGFCGRRRLMLLNQFHTDWRKMCNSSHQTTVQISHAINLTVGTPPSASDSRLFLNLWPIKSRKGKRRFLLSPGLQQMKKVYFKKAMPWPWPSRRGEKGQAFWADNFGEPHKRTESTSASRSERRVLKWKG